MAKGIRLDELKEALLKRVTPREREYSESDYKRRLVKAVNELPGGRARRVEDKYAVGVLDLILKLPDHPLILAEGKVIDGFVFGPTMAQFEEGKKWEAAGVECLLIGWKIRRMYISPWVEKADIRTCFTYPGITYGATLWEYFR